MELSNEKQGLKKMVVDLRLNLAKCEPQKPLRTFEHRQITPASSPPSSECSVDSEQKVSQVSINLSVIENDTAVQTGLNSVDASLITFEETANWLNEA